MGAVIPKIKTTDKIVRKKLIETLIESNGTLGVIEEFEVARGKARADVVCVANGMIHAYEIKSDADTLLRLPRQIRYYNQVFSTVTLVVGAEHVIEALYVIPDWWGVIVAEMDEDGLRLNQIRQVGHNNHIDYASISDLLSKNELVEVLSSRSEYGSYYAMSKPKLVNEVQKEMTKESFIGQLSSTLLSRNGRVLSALEVAL